MDRDELLTQIDKELAEHVAGMKKSLKKMRRSVMLMMINCTIGWLLHYQIQNSFTLTLAVFNTGLTLKTIFSLYKVEKRHTEMLKDYANG